MSDQQTAEAQLWQLSLDRVAMGVIRLSLDGQVCAGNELLCQKLGYTQEEICQLTIFDINPTFTPEDWARHIQGFIGDDKTRSFETLHRRKSGVIFPVEVTVRYLEHGGRPYFIASSRDLTEEKLAAAEQEKLRAQLAQAQKLEVVGRLAGGVAHDFNNMLTVIFGRAEEMLEQVDADSPLREMAEDILLAGQRSAELTRQLLGFARKQTFAPELLDLNEAVAETLKMLQRLVGEAITVSMTPGPDLWLTKLDPVQLDQVLVNLLVNARDAISGTGTVTLETANVTVGGSLPSRPGLPAGNYVRLTVRDSGYGMDRETLEHIFEPFFTTKALGRGTGLGLATVFGIVSQNEGAIHVDSEPGQGTTFSLYFPRQRGVLTPAARETHVTEGGTETILLVEDDELVLRLTRALLETLGYTVYAAPSPRAALEFVRTHGSELDLLVTDLVMPEMTGRELARRVRAELPGIGVVLTSGYAPDLGGPLDAGVEFIRKPFTRTQLDARVRAALTECGRADVQTA